MDVPLASEPSSDERELLDTAFYNAFCKLVFLSDNDDGIGALPIIWELTRAFPNLRHDDFRILERKIEGADVCGQKTLDVYYYPGGAYNPENSDVPLDPCPPLLLTEPLVKDDDGSPNLLCLRLRVEAVAPLFALQFGQPFPTEFIGYLRRQEHRLRWIKAMNITSEEELRRIDCLYAATFTKELGFDLKDPKLVEKLKLFADQVELACVMGAVALQAEA